MLISIPKLPESLCFFYFVGSISISKQLALIKGKVWATEVYVFLLYYDSMPRVKNNRTLENAKDIRELWINHQTFMLFFLKIWELRSSDKN